MRDLPEDWLSRSRSRVRFDCVLVVVEASFGVSSVVGAVDWEGCGTML